MILKGSQRGGGKALALHLLNAEQNEHVEIAEVRGFMAESVSGAFKEAQALASGTRCQQYLFSVSLSPPETENVRPEVFEGAIAAIETKLGLEGQPRVVVFHEKEGRRHAHAVWSRIDAETMTAKQLSFFKSKLRDVSKALYLENGWKMPRGLMDSKERDPRNFTLDEWQQAKRVGLNTADLRGMVQECWAVSDSRDAFGKALEERGLHLAKGDRRGHVVVSYEGEVFALSRLIDKRAKEVTAKLGKPDDLRSVEDTKAHIAAAIAPRLGGYITEARRIARAAMQPLNDQRQAMQQHHADERRKLDEGQKQRWEAETKLRAGRLRGGVMGLWDRVTGDYQKAKGQNEREAFFALQRDREQRQALVAAQLAERRVLQERIRQTRARHAEQILALHKQAANYRLMSDVRQQRGSERGTTRGEFTRQAEGRSQTAERPQGRDRGSRGPGLER
ncbi:relaxase/mobilization nuclease domain-containing protein [Sphingomonas hengshuiensis]|uniref:Relaxase n=1 Tax=Sphingomonas hengshuiensis TaxID=1609977 RepID=A0A7U4J7J9_9SPHN|nr:relaxase/mobilization nuclease domain-containing protein [Sphingomonas hengshuiensis]AJP71711.1 relaxase [Sphingomonas hengshuiensis]